MFLMQAGDSLRDVGSVVRGHFQNECHHDAKGEGRGLGP